MEKATFTLLVFSTTGGMGVEAQRLIKKLAQKMEYPTGQRYSDSVTYLRKRLRFEVLKTTVISIRGDRGLKLRYKPDNIEDLDLNIEPFS